MSHTPKSKRMTSLMDEEGLSGQEFTSTKRKRCDTWHGEEKKEKEHVLDPGIEQEKMHGDTVVMLI